MGIGSERTTVQKPIIEWAEESGWNLIDPDEAQRIRGGESSPILKSIFIEQLQKLNPGIINSPGQAEDVANRLMRLPPNIEGNLEAWEYLRGLKTVFIETEKRELNLRIIDTERIEANQFHVTYEFPFVSGHSRIRADVVFFINGIPVVVIEAKAATRIEGIADALDQIRRYHEQASELFAQVQIFVITDLVHFMYGPTWNISRKTLFSWREDFSGGFEDLVKSFLNRRQIVKTITDYILFVRRDSELNKVVLRPHQMRAVEKVVKRCKDPDAKRGLIWHTQGSGKTYTMIVTAKKLLEDPDLNNPTVLMIVDRNELQQQLFQNLESVGFGRVSITTSKRHLRELLRKDTRGLIVSMIHKFDGADANLNRRSNIYVLIDEAHRSTGGKLGTYLMAALPNATFIGFTGTPIDRSSHGRSTFEVFGKDDREKGGYTDKYSIQESIEDNTTVPLHYQLAPNELIVDREAMEREFWAAVELEGVADLEEIDRVLDRAVTLKNMLKNNERVDKIAEFVADHFKKYIEPMGYKAFLVAVDREACVLYKKALDKYLPPDYSEVVISRNNNDHAWMREYHLSDDEEARIRKEFRKPDGLPKILIVTEKLLTGYDAPILYCLYLDKPMRDHVLLQAIARVNRPYEDREGRKKTNGLILDFVGIFDNLERALAFDSAEIERVVEDLDVLKKHFEDLIKEGQKKYLPLVSGKDPVEAAEDVLEYFRDREKREEYYRYFHDLQDVYEVLSPDIFLHPFLNDYVELTKIYLILRNAYNKGAPIDKSLLRKTAAILRAIINTSEVLRPLAEYKIGLAELEILVRRKEPSTVKVFNLIRAVREMASQSTIEQPYLIPIGERAEEICRQFEQRQIESEEAVRKLVELVNSIRDAQAEQKHSHLSPEAFALRWWLEIMKNESAERAREVANNADEAFRSFPHWELSRDQERQLRTNLYRALLQSGVPKNKLVEWVSEILELLRRGRQ